MAQNNNRNDRRDNRPKGNNRQNQQGMPSGKPPHIKNPDPMSNVRDMGRYGVRVMRDIAKGKFNFYNEGHIFRNLDLTRATIEECQRQLTKAKIHVNAMQYAYGGSADRIVQEVIMEDMKKVEAYEMCINTLTLVFNTNGDTRYLTILINNLPRYKYNM